MNSPNACPAGRRAPRVPRSRRGWGWTARLGLAVLACTFAGAGQAQSLDEAVDEIAELLKVRGELERQQVLVRPGYFFEMGSERNLLLSEQLALLFTRKLTRHGVKPISRSEDEDRAITLQGRWNIEPGQLVLSVTAQRAVGAGLNTGVSLASVDRRVPVANIDGKYLEPDLESHGRYVVRQLEKGVAVNTSGSGRYLLHRRPFSALGVANLERFDGYLNGKWDPAFTGSRRFSLVRGDGSNGELHGEVYVAGERIEVHLRILGGQGKQVAAATVEMDKGLFPSFIIGPDVTRELAKCAGLVEARRLGDAKECYEGVRAAAPGDARAIAGVGSGLERIAEIGRAARAEAAAVRGVEDAIGRGAFGKAREGLERLGELNAVHPRLAELEEELVRAEREERLRAERERKAAEEAARQARAEEERKRKADDAAFARAKSVGTVEGFAGYLSSYPDGRHRVEARRLRAEAELRKRVPPPGTKFRDCEGAWCPELVVVPSGSFEMGSPPGEADRDRDESPVHRVTIARPFAVGVYEVTFGEWEACVSGGGCGGYRPDDRGWGRGNRPVINVSWEDAQAYVRWLSRETGKEYRLLSEAEWEYAARAGTRTRYWWGGAIGRNRANCYGCGSRWDREKTAPVGAFSANPFGLHDVNGNVWEWVEDCYNDSS